MKFRINIHESTDEFQGNGYNTYATGDKISILKDLRESSIRIVDLRSAIQQAGLDPDVFENAYQKAGAKKLNVWKSTTKGLDLGKYQAELAYTSPSKHRVDVVIQVECSEDAYQAFENEFNSNTQMRFKYINAGFGQIEKTPHGFNLYFGG